VNIRGALILLLTATLALPAGLAHPFLEARLPAPDESLPNERDGDRA
jgi:hypothetical protein